MTSTSEMIVDDNGIEMIVGYEYEKSKCIDFTHEIEVADVLIYTELTSVEIVIGGRGIDILPLMHPKQKEIIIEKLQYE